jgi:LysM repeat protein
MSTPSPFIPQGTLLDRGRLQKRARFKLVIFVVVAFHVILFAAVLIQGCKHYQNAVATSKSARANVVPTLPTNTSALASAPATNPLAAPSIPIPTSAVPAVMEPPARAQTAATNVYPVVKGDTLAKIAQRHGVSVNALAQSNPGVDPVKLRVGQALQIPDNSRNGGIAKRTTSVAKGNVQPQSADQLYTIKSGDTLTRIAQAHGTSIKAIRTLNQLTSDQLIVGKTLKLPKSSATSSNTPPRT